MTWWQWILLAHCATLPLMWLVFYVLYNRLAGDTSRHRWLWVIGVVLDIYVDVMWGTVIFLQVPDERRLFFSARMDDLIVNGSGWRHWLAVQIVGRLLEPFDRSIPRQHNTYGEMA